jgi:hypothetical protein
MTVKRFSLTLPLGIARKDDLFIGVGAPREPYS